MKRIITLIILFTTTISFGQEYYQFKSISNIFSSKDSVQEFLNKTKKDIISIQSKNTDI